MVQASWDKSLLVENFVIRIHTKLACTMQSLKRRDMDKIGNFKMQTLIAKEIISRLDLAKEDQPLNKLERKNFKSCSLGLLIR
jgi:hypothetical protein